MQTLGVALSNVKHVVEFFLRAAGAESGPPLGTVLGNIGLNTSKFCKEFNDFTKDLPVYFNLKVRIFIYDNRTFSFIVLRPSTSFIISLLKFNRLISANSVAAKSPDGFSGVLIAQVLQLSVFIFPGSSIFSSFTVCWSTLSSMNIFLFKS